MNGTAARFGGHSDVCRVCPSVEDVFITREHDAANFPGARGNDVVRDGNGKSVPQSPSGMEGDPGTFSDR